MLKQIIFLFSAVFMIGLLADCPAKYPYSPRNGVFTGSSWEYWCDDWKLSQPGHGTVYWKGSGNDIYVGLFDAPNTKTFKYALILSGWSNSQIKLYRDGSFGNELSTSNFKVPNTNLVDSWSVQFNKEANSITVTFNDEVVFSYVDNNYQSQAGNAQYISFSQYGSNVALYKKDCPTYPYTPRNGVFSGANWEHFCSDWNLNSPGNGSVSFYATGNDLYFGLFDTVDTKTFKYAIIFAGWDNSQIKLYKNGDFSKEIVSVNFKVPDTNAHNAFRFDFIRSTKTIAIIFNGQTVFSYQDSNYENIAGSSQYVSLSQYSSNVVLYRGCPEYPYKPRNGVLSGNSWEYFCPDWQLPVNGSGVINFQAQGNDIYVGIFDAMNSKTFKYAIVFGGGGNIMAGVYENGSFSKALLTTNVIIPNVNDFNNYTVIFSAEKSTVAMYMNGKLVFTYGDVSYNAQNSRFISFSQCFSNVIIRSVSITPFCSNIPSFALIAGHVRMFANNYMCSLSEL